MAKITPERRTEDAVRKSIGILGLEQAAEVICKSESTMYAYGNPDQEKHISVKDALALDMACLEEGGETPFTTMMRLSIDAVDFRGRVDIPNALLDLHAAAGRFSEVVRGAKAPASPGGKTLTQQERKQIMTIGDRVLTDVQQILASVAGDSADKQAA